MNESYDLSELKRQFAAFIIFGEVVEVDYAKKQLKLQEGDLTTAWLPFPFESGQNYRRWRPIALGQQFTAICRGGDTVQGRIIGETAREGRDSPSVDKNVDVVMFNDGSFIKHNSATGEMHIHAAKHLVLTAPRVDIN